jgi:hypothetical protein
VAAPSLSASIPGYRTPSQSGIPEFRELLAKSEGSLERPFLHIHGSTTMR